MAANITVVNTNANFSESDDLRNITLPKSVQINMNGTVIGIVGAVLHETAQLSKPGELSPLSHVSTSLLLKLCRSILLFSCGETKNDRSVGPKILTCI